MKITPFDELWPNREGVGGAVSVYASGSNSADGDTSGGGDVVGEPGAYSVVGLRSMVSLASNIGGGTVGDVLTIIQASPRLAAFATPSNSGVSFGSNATRVSETSGVGALSTAAREDHRHDGIGTITASSSNTMQRGTFNLRPGTNVSFGLTDGDGDGEHDTLTINASAAGGGGSGLTIEEVDGTPTATATKLVLPNGTLSYAGTVATYTPAAGGGADWNLDVNESGTSFANFTAASGTWSSNGTEIIQTDTSNAKRRTKYNNLVPLGFPFIIQVEVYFTSLGGAGTPRGGVIISGGSSDQGVVSYLQSSGAVTADKDSSLVICTTSTTVSTTTWYTLRMVMAGAFLSLYVDGTFKTTGDVFQTTYRAGSRYVGLYAEAASVKFRNFKVWTLSSGAP